MASCVNLKHHRCLSYRLVLSGMFSHVQSNGREIQASTVFEEERRSHYKASSGNLLTHSALIAEPLLSMQTSFGTCMNDDVCILNRGSAIKAERVSVAVSCVYDTCFAVKTCDGLYHFIFSIYHVGIPFGFQAIIWTFVRHTVSRYLTFPAIGFTWSIWTNHRPHYVGLWCPRESSHLYFHCEGRMQSMKN